MKNTKKIILGTSLFLALGAIPTLAYELWVDGVDRDNGWSDFNKSGGGDSELCWAAAAANVIDWWQKQYEIPYAVPQGEEIWKTFKSSFVDEGGMPYNAVRWWIDGALGVKLKDGDVGGFHRKPWESYGLRSLDYVTNPIFSDTDSYADCSATIISHLENGCGMTLALNCMHEVTLWGVEHDENNLITKIWITDSDDKQTGLVGVRCDGSTGKITLNGDDYKAFDRTDISIYGYTILMPADNFFKRISPSIPEPSAFGLLAGIGALALVGARRSRRKKS